MGKLKVCVHWTWGLLQTLIGAIVFLCVRKNRHEYVNGSIVTEIPGHWGGITLGMFIFVDSLPIENINEDFIVTHEYGHTIQSLILGPVWLLVIGLPSLLWAGFGDKYREKNNISYYDFYTEKWANILGSKYIKGGMDNGGN